MTGYSTSSGFDKKMGEAYIKGLPAIYRYSTNIALHLNKYENLSMDALQKFTNKMLALASLCNSEPEIKVYTSKGVQNIHERAVEEYPISKVLSGAGKKFTPLREVRNDYPVGSTILNVYLVSVKDFTSNEELQKILRESYPSVFTVILIYFLKSDRANASIPLNMVSGDNYTIEKLENVDALSTAHLYFRVLNKFGYQSLNSYAGGF